MSHREYWTVIDPDSGLMWGQCGTCGWSSTKYEHNGILPRLLQEECERHQRKPDAVTIEGEAVAVEPAAHSVREEALQAGR